MPGLIIGSPIYLALACPHPPTVTPDSNPDILGWWLLLLRRRWPLRLSARAPSPVPSVRRDRANVGLRRVSAQWEAHETCTHWSAQKQCSYYISTVRRSIGMMSMLARLGRLRRGRGPGEERDEDRPFSGSLMALGKLSPPGWVQGHRACGRRSSRGQTYLGHLVMPPSKRHLVTHSVTLVLSAGDTDMMK